MGSYMSHWGWRVNKERDVLDFIQDVRVKLLRGLGRRRVPQLCAQTGLDLHMALIHPLENDRNAESLWGARGNVHRRSAAVRRRCTLR